MKRRIFSLLLSAIMLVSLIPVAAISVFADSHTHSANIVSMIKSLEGFNPNAFWDASQWSIGYGTKGMQGQTITEAQASEALEKELTALDAKINDFAAQYGKSFTQAQHDALVSLCFNCGWEWMQQSGRLKDAILYNTTGNEFLYIISLWANINSVPNSGLINRRLAEANLYFTGTYSKNPPSNYTYVILNANGGTPGSGGEDKMQGFDSTIPTKILAKDPSKAGSTFGGWYTSAVGGEAVTELNSGVAGKTLYAQYGIVVTVNKESANVRRGAGVNYTQVGTKYNGDKLVIVETSKVGNAMWGRFAEGWVALENTDYTGTTEIGKGEGVVATGTVRCSSYINVRKAAGTSNAIVGSVANGTKVSIYEKAMVGSVQWGRISSGWISLDYVNIDSDTGSTGNITWGGTNGSSSSNSGSSSSSSSSNTSYTAGTVTGNRVNVRSAAGVGNTVVTMLNSGTSVKVYEQVTKDNASWGRIDQGWICLNYVKLASTPTNTNTDTNNYSGGSMNWGGGNPGASTSSNVIATGTVNTTTNLNVRSGAGTNYGMLRYLSSGTKINIYEKKTVGGQEWGRIDSTGWVCLSYVKLDSQNSTPTNGNTSNAIATGKVSSNTALNVRSGAGTGYAKLRSLTPGTAVNIYEKTTVNGQEWGRIDSTGWICLSYVTLNGTNTAATTGTAKVNVGLNVRAAAGTNNAIVGSYFSGDVVTILEVTSVNGTNWGRTNKGWICMNYVQMTSSSTTTTGLNWG